MWHSLLIRMVYLLTVVGGVSAGRCVLMGSAQLLLLPARISRILVGARVQMARKPEPLRLNRPMGVQEAVRT